MNIISASPFSVWQIMGAIITLIVGIEHLGICLLEMFGRPEAQAKAFDLDVNFVKKRAAKIILANQGIYNGMLGLLILILFFVLRGQALILFRIWEILLAMIILIAIYGGFTATKKIFWVQMMPALLALILLLL